MKIYKKIIGISLMTTVLALGVTACSSDNSGNITETKDTEEKDKGTIEPTDKDGDKVDETDENTTDSLGESRYVKYDGVVSEVTRDGESSVLVHGRENEEGFKDIKFNITEDTRVVDEKKIEVVEIDEVEKEKSVSVFYEKDSPMTRSIPPMTNADVVVIREDGDEKLGVIVSVFDKDLVSEDNSLKLSVDDETVIVDDSGEKLTRDDIVDKEVVAFYGPIMTMSIPGQSAARKIILLKGN